MVFSRRRKKSLREEVLTSKKSLISIPREKMEEGEALIGKPPIEQIDLQLNDLNLKDLGDNKNKDDDIFSSNPASCKGSFLRNKLENPLFGNGKEKSKERKLSLTFSFRSNRSRADRERGLSRSKLDIVLNAKKEDERDNDEEGEEGSDYSDEDISEFDDHDADLLKYNYEKDSRVEDDDKTSVSLATSSRSLRKSRILNLSKYTKYDKGSKTPKKEKKEKLKKTKSTKSKTKNESPPKVVVQRAKSRGSTYSQFLLDTATKTYRRGLLGGRSKRWKSKNSEVESVHQSTERERERLKRQEKNSSLSSSNSNSSENSESNTNSESEIDLLTKYENTLNESKRTDGFKLYTEAGQPVFVTFNFDYLQINDKICFYEDLASWTNDSKCLRMIYVKNKNTAEQERVEIKLYVVDKEYQGKVTPYDLNELLRTKIAVLICDKMHISMNEAMAMTKKQATDKEISFINEQIDISTEQCMAKSYTKDL